MKNTFGWAEKHLTIKPLNFEKKGKKSPKQANKQNHAKTMQTIGPTKTIIKSMDKSGDLMRIFPSLKWKQNHPLIGPRAGGLGTLTRHHWWILLQSGHYLLSPAPPPIGWPCCLPHAESEPWPPHRTHPFWKNSWEFMWKISAINAGLFTMLGWNQQGLALFSVFCPCLLFAAAREI